MVYFVLSLFLSIVTGINICLLFNLKRVQSFFVFGPFLLIYTGFISTLLSPHKQLTANNFLLVQTVFCVLLLAITYSKFKNVQQTTLSWLRVKHDTNSSFFTTLCLFAISVVLVVSLVAGLIVPIVQIDESTYKGSTPLYWVQNMSISRFPTYDERKNIFIMGSGIIYMWPNLFRVGYKAADAFYWAGFPFAAISVFLLGLTVSKNKKSSALAALLFVSCPLIIGQYFTFSLTQEVWLSVVVCSFIYFIYQSITDQKTQMQSIFLAGMSFSSLLFVKHTAAPYVLLFLVYLHQKNKYAILFSALKGFLLGIILSGYVVLTLQNTALYSHPLGTQEFRTTHFANISTVQVLTHLIRIPFVFFEVPVFSVVIAETIEEKVTQLADLLGATAVIDMEYISEVGKFAYKNTSPNLRFGITGIVWLVIFIISTFKRIVGASKEDKSTKLLNLFFMSLVIQIVTAKWLEAGDIPYRHLLSGITIISAFAALYAPMLQKKLGQSITTMLVLLIFFAAFEQTQALLYKIDDFLTRSKSEQSLITQTTYYGSYQELFTSITKPTSFLLIEPPENGYHDFGLFWLHNQNLNSVYLVPVGNAQADLPRLLKTIADKNPTYLFVQKYTTIHQEVFRAYGYSNLEINNDNLTIFKKD